jgi:hypothetical protein
VSRAHYAARFTSRQVVRDWRKRRAERGAAGAVDARATQLP